MRYKSLILVAILATFAYAEKSVYSDADFVTSDEIAKKNSREIFKLKQKINSLNEKIEGLKSVISGLESELAQIKQTSNTQNLEKIINELSQRVAKLESKPATVTVQPKEESINTPKKEFKVTEKKEPPKKKISSSELYKKAVINFNNNRLSKAKEQFLELLKRDYKKASVNFYLGEIAYKRKNNADAISYYQKSATLNENASYMDKLLLHTAITLHRSGKKEQAKNFFQAVVDTYPQSASAKEAKKYLK
jgi:TolA-binding protein